MLRVIFARQECDPELRAGEPLLQEVILCGRELTQDNLLDDNEKEKITRDTAQLLEHYDHLRNFIDDEQERFVISVIIYIRLLLQCIVNLKKLLLHIRNRCKVSNYIFKSKSAV